MMAYLDMAELVNNHVVKTGNRRLDQVEIKRNPLGPVGIATPTRCHGTDGDRR